MSPHSFSSDEHSLLCKGFNFALVPRRILTENIISTVESSIRTLLKIEADEMHFETSQILRKAQVPPFNIPRSGRLALRDLPFKPRHFCSIFS